MHGSPAAGVDEVDAELVKLEEVSVSVIEVIEAETSVLGKDVSIGRLVLEPEIGSLLEVDSEALELDDGSELIEVDDGSELLEVDDGSEVTFSRIELLVVEEEVLIVVVERLSVGLESGCEEEVVEICAEELLLLLLKLDDVVLLLRLVDEGRLVEVLVGV